MVITRTPFRISFFGGGTDFPVWYKENGGAVISTSINKYCYITTRFLPPFFPYKYRIRYTSREETSKVSDINHPSVKECIKFMGIKKGLEMVHSGDIPAMSGIGSSSSFTVGFLHSLYGLMDLKTTKKKLLKEAIFVEQQLIKEDVGSQDQSVAAYGGLNKINFHKNSQISVTPIKIEGHRLKSFESHLLLIFTGFQRKSSVISFDVIKNIPNRKKELEAISELTEEAYKILQSKGSNFVDFGKLLDHHWQLKKSLSTFISNPAINEIYDAGKKAGAIGGKILGAGNGGFILLFAKPEHHPMIKKRLKNLLFVPFKFENTGSQIIYKMADDFERIAR